MRAYAIRYQLEAGPAGKLPAAEGFLEAAEEHGLLWVLEAGERIYPLSAGVVWGQFEAPSAALAAFGRALQTASELLGFQLHLVRALASELDERSAPVVGAGRAANPALRAPGRFSLCLLHQLYDPPAYADRAGQQPAVAARIKAAE